jgi:hypothetical protein
MKSTTILERAGASMGEFVYNVKMPGMEIRILSVRGLKKLYCKRVLIVL